MSGNDMQKKISASYTKPSGHLNTKLDGGAASISRTTTPRNAAIATNAVTKQ
ncbi:hypothetical protein [Candidatus Sarmatiella mevalonica]|uniref:hypothetical protein n=1 Tax=Candidatus Sarmatiella mevalonica TaxID=2770581 RepID=UPI001923000C|nr:hypothetical protein [Candidatus Sarmatiella mevalonica]